MTYSISQIAEKMGLSVHTLRFYDKEGLLPDVQRVNGRRVFTDSDLAWLQILNCLKSTGMPLKEIRQYMELCQLGDSSLVQRQEMILNQKKNVEEQIRFLQEHLKVIERKIEYYEKAISAGTENFNTCYPRDSVRESGANEGGSIMRATVYFSRTITPEKVLELYQLAGKELPGKVAVKVHSGEKGNQNFLRPDFWKDVIDYVGGTVVECNTAYEGARNTTKKHRQLIADHGWSKAFPVDLLDAEGPDLELEIPGGKVIRKNYVGKDIACFDSMLVLSHFKGHPMGGYGGALKQLSIGVASSYGKAYIHGAGDPKQLWTADHNAFLESMADAASSVVDYFRGNLVYVNVMKNMSVDCDCCAVAEDPCMADIGILVSTDPIAVDQACLDLVYASNDPGKAHLLERIESRNGAHTLEAAASLGFGTRQYDLIEV